jgi:hypothetical protein
VLFTCCEASARVEGYRIIGTIKNVTPSGKVSTQNRFDAQIGRCKWIIRTYLSPDTGISYVEDAFDGRIVYSYIQFTNQTSPSANTSAAIIEENNVPHEKTDFSTSIWLAYASGCYFNEIKDNKVKLFFDFNDSTLRLNNQSVKVAWERSKLPPFVPVYVNFYDDGFVYSRRNNTSSSFQRKPPYDKGFITYKYLVTTFTNISGITIPAGFQLESYVTKPDGKTSEDIKLLFTQFGSVEKIIINPEEQDFAPKIDSATYVEDRRFASAKPAAQQIFYLNTSGKWLPTSSKSVMDVYKKALGDASISASSITSNNAKIIRIIILVVFLLPLSFLMFLAIKKRNSK